MTSKMIEGLLGSHSAAHQTTTDLQEFQAAIEDVQLPPKLPDLHSSTQFLPHFVCLHFYVGT